MLFFLNAFGERIGRVVVFDINARLREDWAGIVTLVHQMNGAARNAATVFQNRAMNAISIHSLPAKRGQQRRMNVENATGKRFQ